MAQNLCPFAGKPLAVGSVLLVEISGRDDSEILLDCHALLKSFASSNLYETALFVLANGKADFMEFLELADTLELLLEESFIGEFSLATFHPKYQFAEIDPEDVVHHIHRSPYPLFHILRETSIEEVRNTMGDTSAITARNQEHAESLGVEFFKQYLPKL